MNEGRAEQQSPGGQFRVFISYRREDAAADARLLHERLQQRFGHENVFLDVVALEPGVRWLEAIKAHGESSGAFLALIGPRWVSILTERAATRLEAPGQDIVKLELQLALSRGSGVQVIPVLVGGATMPAAEQLPRSLRALSGTHAVELRHDHFDQDVALLIEALERIQSRGSAPLQAAAERREPPETSAARPESASPTISRPPMPAPDPHGMAPDERHYETVVRYMADQGTVVPLLGSRVAGALPDAEKLAADLAASFGIERAPEDLPRVAQQVYVSAGRPDLVRRLRQILSAVAEPSPVHRFLAQFPRELEQLGLPPRYQMIVTTNYDASLERAFENENEPYDLAIYMASGPDSGKFVHFPFDRDPQPINVPNQYAGFPIDDYGELERTVIVKIHGGLDVGSGYGAKDNFVITEDHYIEYLSSGPVESLVPVQILAKLTESHCLFLGYGMRDWNLRVFLKRIWKGEPLGSKSWAIEREPDVLEKDFWSQAQVEFFAVPLEHYVDGLHRQLAAWGVRA